MILVKSIDNQEKETKANGLIHVLHRYEIQKPIRCAKINIADQLETEDKKVADKQQFVIDDELKEFFKNEMTAYYVAPDQSDLSVARYEK